MDAVKFFEEAKRMCNYIGDCEGCPLEQEKNSSKCILWTTPNAIDNPEEIVDYVKTWASEHPVKTRQSEFLKMYPNVRIINGFPGIRPCELDRTYKSAEGKCSWSCNECCKDYWSKEVEF